MLSDLSVALEEADGQVEVAATPTIEADRTQMEQLFRNLIGNGLKFRRPGDCRRSVTVADGEGEAQPLDARHRGPRIPSW